MRRLLLLLLLPASGFTAPQLNNVEVHGMIAALCSMLTNHISAVKPHVIFNLHEWSLQENRPGSVRAEGECARPVDPQAPTNKRGQAFRLASTGNVANGEMELFAQFDHAIGKIRFVREGVFDEKSQQLRSEWRLRGVNLVPLGTVDSELVCQIPLLRWVVESLAPVQQTNFSVDRFQRANGEMELGMFSMRDLYVLDLWTGQKGGVLRVNMGSYAKKAWGEMPRGEYSDAVFWSDDGRRVRGCSNFKGDGSRGNLSLDGCRGILRQYGR